MNKEQFVRPCVLGIVVALWLVLKPQTIFAQVEVPIATETSTPVQEPTVEVIDLSIDEDYDGMPDELQAALDQLNEVYESYLQEDGTIRTDDEAQAALRQAEEIFRNQLPYSEQTRSAQKRVGEIYKALTENPEPEIQEQLLAELPLLELQMLSDTNFALIDQVLSRRLSDKLSAKINVDEGEVPTPTATRQATPIPDATAIPTEQVPEDNALVQSSALHTPGLQQWVPQGWYNLFPRDPCTSNLAPNFGELVRGEIMLLGQDLAVPNFFYAKKYNHTAIYDGSSGGTQYVYEAWNGVGVSRRPLSTVWQGTGGCVAFAQVNGTTPLQRQTSLDWAQTTYGINNTTPYNYNFIDKNTDTALYCSQLVWKVFGHLGINLDSNDLTYRNWLVARHAGGDLILGAIITTAANAMVAPDEIALHGSVNIYRERLNP